ncbi:MAG: DNA-directed DNA polymerase [Candidatus Nanohaloarchaeota archaeon QJJ-5]|nr:DNA-directed DNA polymerase [Candidatus Nanohaloarchaeota archaeon QJJ-5]
MEITGWLLDADYIIEDDVPIIRLFLSTEDGPVQARIDSFTPYFYLVPAEDIDDLAEAVADLEPEEGTITGTEQTTRVDNGQKQEVLKVETAVPPDVPKLKDQCWELDAVQEAREFDIPFYKRFLFDHDLRPPSRITVEGDPLTDPSFDGQTIAATSVAQTETDDILPSDTLAFDLEVYKDEIIMCSFYSDGYRKVLVNEEDGFEAEYVEPVASEQALLERMMAIIKDRDPDILVGYNTDEYDFDVLRDRCEEHGLELTIGRTDRRVTFQRRGRFQGALVEGRIHLDLYAFVSTVMSMTMDTETLTLDAVAQELLGKQKEDMHWEDIKNAWRDREQLDELASYALKDSELAYELAESIVPQIHSLSVLTGLVPFDTCRTSYGQLVENFMIREAAQRDILVPNRPSQRRIGERHSQGDYLGGFVYEPEEGLHEDIAIFDFRSLYPTIILSHNISPDTLDRAECTDELAVEVDEETYTFCQDEQGFIPALLDDLVTERYEIKDSLQELDEQTQAYRDADNRQNALKILSNAFYGYLGYASARWYSRPSAEATTKLGREYIHETIDIAEEMGFEVAYGDTDSVFLKGETIQTDMDTFLDRVNSMLPSYMELEFEGYFERGLFTYTDEGRGAKKTYALLSPDGDLKITGFEYVRRDWSRLARETQEQVIRHVLENDVEGAVEVVTATIEDLKNGDVDPESLTIYTSMSKRPENYDTKAPHVEAAKKAQKRGHDIGAGDTVDYVITAGGGSISDRAELTQYADDYDATYYIDKQIIPVAHRVLKVFGYSEEQLRGEGKQSGLNQFA